MSKISLPLDIPLLNSTKKLKVALVQPYYMNTWEALGLGYVSSYAKKHYKGELYLSFYHGNFDSDEIIVNGCSEVDIIGFSCTSPTFAHAVRLTKKIKEINPKVHIVVGGFHVSALREKIFEKDPIIDQIVVGKGESAFLSILNGNREKIVHGSKLGFDELPWPDRDLIKNERCVQLCEDMIGQRITSFQSVQVCPLQCKFCSEGAMTGKMNRSTNPLLVRNVNDTLDEIDFVIKKYRLDEFKFVDATWDISAAYVIEFCKEKLRRGNTTKWEALIHAAFVSEEMFYWMAKTNVYQINVGCESGSDKILKDVGKGANREKLKNVFKWAKDAGIRRRGFFLLGMPNETQEDLDLTESLIDEMQPDQVGFTILCPYPNLPNKLYDHEKYKDIDWENTDEYSNDFWYNKAFTNQQLKEKQKYLTDKYQKLLCERQEEQTFIRKYQTVLPEHVKENYPGNFAH